MTVRWLTKVGASTLLHDAYVHVRLHAMRALQFTTPRDEFTATFAMTSFNKHFGHMVYERCMTRDEQ
jgi:hypothetical protein